MSRFARSGSPALRVAGKISSVCYAAWRRSCYFRPTCALCANSLMASMERRLEAHVASRVAMAYSNPSEDDLLRVEALIHRRLIWCARFARAAGLMRIRPQDLHGVLATAELITQAQADGARSTHPYGFVPLRVVCILLSPRVGKVLC